MKIISKFLKTMEKCLLLSGDYNKIHIDELEGYNSMFGQNICHGV